MSLFFLLNVILYVVMVIILLVICEQKELSYHTLFSWDTLQHVSNHNNFVKMEKSVRQLVLCSMVWLPVLQLSAAAVVAMLLLRAGDVERNPGPLGKSVKVIEPCVIRQSLSTCS